MMYYHMLSPPAVYRAIKPSPAATSKWSTHESINNYSPIIYRYARYAYRVLLLKVP